MDPGLQSQAYQGSSLRILRWERHSFVCAASLCATRHVARILRLESLEARQVLAAGSLTPAIAGTVFQDTNADNQPSAGEGLAGVTVRFYIDDGDGVFEPNGGDVLFGGNVSTDANGEYCVDNLDPDLRLTLSFSRRRPWTGSRSSSKSVRSLNPDCPVLLIDSFISAQEAATASPPAPSSDTSVLMFSDETEVIGQERDLMAFLEAGDGEVRVNVNPFGNRPTLRYNADVAVTGSGVVVWDGIDASAGSLAMGLNGRDLTQGGHETGIIFRIGAVAAGATAEVRLFQGSESNFSQATLSIPITTGGAAESYEFIPFADFVGSVQPAMWMRLNCC